jgi:putative FmdB family regulatory protein
VSFQVLRELGKLGFTLPRSNPKPFGRLDFNGRQGMILIMPIYEFTCEACAKDFETLVRSSDWEGEVECPSCGSEKLEKQLSVFAATSGDSSSVGDMPPCSGMPSNCGRCALDN